MIAFNVRQGAAWFALTWIKVNCHPSQYVFLTGRWPFREEKHHEDLVAEQYPDTPTA